MGLLDRFLQTGGPARGVDPDDARYLSHWVGTHYGVEAYVEPRTTVSDVTVVLVAFDGEWTRRRVRERGAQQLSRRLSIPVYDVRRTGYPQRMRDHDTRRRFERRRPLERELNSD